MKRLLAGAVSTAVALVGLGVAAAAPAAAIDRSVGASCSSIDISLWDVPTGTEVAVTVDGETVSSESVVDGWYSRSFPLDWSQAHDWTVVADLPEDAGDDVSESGTTEACGSDPNVTADAWTSCQDVTVSVMGYPAGSRATVVVDGTTLVDQTFDASYYTTQSIDWTVDHTWSVTVDADDDTLDRSWDGVTTACDSDPNVVLEVSAWCGSVEAWGWGYPVGSQVALTVDGQVMASTTVDESGYASLSAQPNPTADFGWQVTVQDPAGAVLRERSDVVTGCTPWTPSVVSASATCSSLSVWVDVAAVEPGSSIEVQVDGQVLGTETLDSYFSRDFDLTWDAAHSWAVRVVGPDGSELASDSGVSEPCASDPNPPLMVSAQCSTVWAMAQDPVFGAGSTFELVVDGEVVSSQEFEVHADASTSVDHLVAHTYTATATTPDGTVFEATGSTTPCTQGEQAVHVSTDCGAIDVSVNDPWLGEGARVRLDVDGATVLDEPVGDGGWFDQAVAVDQAVDHDWTVTLDDVHDLRDWTESGTAWGCSGGPTMVAAVMPEPITACGATLADVVLPPSTEAITYTLTAEGVLATANPGYAISRGLTDSQYWITSDTTAVLQLSQVLRPQCDLPGTATAQVVCDAGEAFLEYAVEAPEGAVEERFSIDVEGPNHGYDVIQGDPGFGHPFTGRLPWQALVTNADGTISSTWNPELAVTSVHVHFYLSVPVSTEAGAYEITYEAEVPLPETGDPCASTGSGDDDERGDGHAFGRDHVGHPVLHNHPVFGDLPGKGALRNHA